MVPVCKSVGVWTQIGPYSVGANLFNRFASTESWNLTCLAHARGRFRFCSVLCIVRQIEFSLYMQNAYHRPHSDEVARFCERIHCGRTSIVRYCPPVKRFGLTTYRLASGLARRNGRQTHLHGVAIEVVLYAPVRWALARSRRISPPAPACCDRR